NTVTGHGQPGKPRPGSPPGGGGPAPGGRGKGQARAGQLRAGDERPDRPPDRPEGSPLAAGARVRRVDPGGDSGRGCRCLYPPVESLPAAVPQRPARGTDAKVSIDNVPGK